MITAACKGADLKQVRQENQSEFEALPESARLVSFRATAFSILMFLLNGCYVGRLAIHQNDLFNSRRPISEVLRDEKIKPSLRQKLLLVQSVVKFSNRAGLNGSSAYLYYIQSNQPVVSYLVQAARPDKLESIKWWFPIVGSVPYRGYFEKAEREAKAKELEDEGLDVHRSGVGAFSSLGWFDDPVFSSMIRRNEASLVHLVIHELVHRTIWVAGSVKFNENLAEFIAVELTPKFLKEARKEKLIGGYFARREDRKLFKSWLRTLKGELKSFYQNPPTDRQALLTRKAEIFASHQHKKPKFKSYDFVSGRTWNNASVLGASLYSPDIPRFKKAMKCTHASSTKEFIRILKSSTEGGGDPFKALDDLCKRSDD